MYNINTKAKRTELLNHIKESRLNKGYKLETFEGLQIFTKFDEVVNKHYLEVYCDNSTKPLLNYYYINEAQMLARIETTKQNYSRRQTYKAERKANQNGRLTGAAACADAIRAELKEVFKGVKFSVRSETFSGGNSVHISWKDGLLTKEVEAITNKYQEGRFNGMEDIYEYSNTNENLAQAKYVSCSRDMSEETAAILKPIAEQLFNDLKANQDARVDRMYDYQNFLHQIFYISSFKQGAKPLNIVDGDESPYFKILFDESECKEVIKPKQTEVKQGSVNVVTYGKGLAVIGETYAIKDKLKAIGGRFNKFLTVGAGWVFTSDKLEDIKSMLLSLKESKEVEQAEPVQEVSTEETKQAEVKHLNVLPIPQNNMYKLESLKIIWHEGLQNPSFEGATFTNWDDIQAAFLMLWDANESTNDLGGYTKVKVELKFINKEPQTFRIDITNKINNGDFNPSQEHIITHLQSLEDEEQPEVKILTLTQYASTQQRLLLN